MCEDDVRHAVTDGEPDGNRHPYVGLMVAQTAKGEPLWRCSGTLLSPTLFLTAGHCTEAPAAHVEIWFDADVESGIPANGYPFEGDAGGRPYFTGDFSILLSNNANTGGTCFGDSGGPNFIDDSNVGGGVTSFGINGNCAGTGGVYRVNRKDGLDFLYGTFGQHLK